MRQLTPSVALVRRQRPEAMQLWQLDIVFGPMLVDTGTGELRQARVVTRRR